MNILYLLKTLKTDKMAELVETIEAPQIDINLAIWDAIERGDIEVIEKKKGEIVKPLKEAEPYRDEDLVMKIRRVMQHYAKNEANITRGMLAHYMKDVTTMRGYPAHEHLMTVQSMIDAGEIVEDIISVPEIKGKRPFHRFVFLCLPGNPNEEWNKKAIDKWIADFSKAK